MASVSPTKRRAETPASPRGKDKERRIGDISPPVTLDHGAYPHILDLVLSFSTHSSLIALRGVSQALRDRIDKHLFAHVTLREQDFDWKEAKHSHNDWHTPSRVELRDALGHKLPGVRWELDVPWEERLAAAFRLRQLTRTVDITDHIDIDNQMPLPQEELRALPDDKRSLVREHDCNLLRLAFSRLDGMRLFEVAETCAFPVKTSVQYSAFESPWDGYYIEPMATFGVGHTDPLDKLVVVLQWDPALRMLQHAVIMWDEQRNRSNSFYRHRNRVCQPKEIVLVFRHDTRETPDFRLGDVGRYHEDANPPEHDRGPYGMFSSLIEFMGEKLGLVEKFTIVGLDTILPHLAREERGDELHELIRDDVKHHWDSVFLSVTDKVQHLHELHNDDMYVGQLQSHPEFHRIAMVEYWKVIRQQREAQGWGSHAPPPFVMTMGPHGMQLSMPGLLMGGADTDSDSDGMGSDSDADSWETDLGTGPGSAHSEDGEEAAGVGGTEGVEVEVGGEVVEGGEVVLAVGSPLNGEDVIASGSNENSLTTNRDTAAPVGDSHGEAPTVDDHTVNEEPMNGNDDGGDNYVNDDSMTDSDGIAFDNALDTDSDDTSDSDSDMASTTASERRRFRLASPPSPVTIWADDEPCTPELHDRRTFLSEKVDAAYDKLAAGEEYDMSELKITLDDWYAMAQYSRTRLPCTEDQLDPEELAALRLFMPPLPPRLDLPHATIEFVSHAEYEQSVGKETYAWELDEYDYAKHAAGCGCGDPPVGHVEDVE